MFSSCLSASWRQYGECARFSCSNAVISASTASTAGKSSENDAAGIAGMTALSISPASKDPASRDSEVEEIAAASGGWSAASGCQVLMKYTALSNCVR